MWQQLIAGSGKLLVSSRHRQRDLECGSFADLAFDSDVAAVIADNAVTDSEAKPGSFANLFGGEKRIVDFGQMFWRYAYASVAESDDDRIEVRFGGDFQTSALRHGVACVQNQIHENLLQLGCIARRKRQLNGVIADNPDFGVAKLGFQQLDCVVQHAVQIHGNQT